jgi:GntR family transcriptional regulator
MDSVLTLEKHSAVPLYMQLKRLLEHQITAGTLPPHSRVPSERELSEQFAISRMTVRQALAELIQEGRLYTSPGKGTFVAEPKIRQNLEALTSFTEEMRARGFNPTTRLIRREMIAAPDAVAQSLRIAEGTSVICIERLRLADDEPMAIETACLSFPGMDRLLTVDLGGSLYAVLREYFGLIPTEAAQEFEAMLARPRERMLLHLHEGAPVLKVQRTTFDSERRPFEHVQSVYRGDRYRFVARLVRESGV